MYSLHSGLVKFCRHVSTKPNTTLPVKIPYEKKADFLEYKKPKRGITKRPRIRSENQLEALGNTHFTSDVYKKDMLPFRSPAKNMAVKRGDILPADIEEKVVIERKPEGLDFYFKDDPGFLKATKELLEPMRTKLEEKRIALIKEDVSSEEKFFESRSVDVKNFNYYLQCLEAQGKLDKIPGAYQTMMKWSLVPNQGTFISLISSSPPKDALQYFKRITDMKISPSSAVYGALIKSYVNAKKIDEAFEILQVMKSNGLKPGQVHHCTLLRGCVETGDLTRAWNHYEQIVAFEDVLPDSITYSTMMNAAAKGRQTEKALSMLNEMELYHIYPTELSFLALLKAYSRRKDWRPKAAEVIDKMRLYGYSPSLEFYNLLIQTFAKLGNVEKIKDYIQEMTQRGIKPDEYTFSAYLHGLAHEVRLKPALVNQNIESALLLFDDMKKREIEYKLTTMNNLLTVYTYGKVLNRAEEYFRNKFTELGFVPDHHSYANMIIMYSQAKRPDQAVQLLREMEEKGLNPTYSSYREIIFSYISMGRYPMGHQMMKEMFEKYKFMLAPHDVVKYKHLTRNTAKKRGSMMKSGKLIDKMGEML